MMIDEVPDLLYIMKKNRFLIYNGNSKHERVNSKGVKINKSQR